MTAVTITSNASQYIFSAPSQDVVIAAGVTISPNGVFANGVLEVDETLANYGTIGGGVALSENTLIRNGSTTSTAASISGAYGLQLSAGGETVFNYGAITGTTNQGIQITQGGAVTNGGSASTAASITGHAYGIQFNTGTGTVHNYGTITGVTSDGVFFADGGSLTNGAKGSITGSGRGVRALVGAGTVTNYGHISGSLFGVYFQEGGRVTNGNASDTTAAISGEIDIEHLGGVVGNFGTISEVKLAAGGTVTNGGTSSSSALISASGYAVDIELARGSVANFGKITSSAGMGVYFNDGGYVTNGATGSISGLNFGVYISGFGGTVTNQGAISASTAVFFDAGGLVRNGSATDTTASIKGFSGIAMAAYGTVSNYGTVAATGGAGVSLSSGGIIFNGGGTITASLISGAGGGVAISGQHGEVVNYGSISATTLSGVALTYGGSVTNGGAKDSTALISGAYGVTISGGQGTVTNYGTITGAMVNPTIGAVMLLDGGTVTNGTSSDKAASITGAAYGVYLHSGHAYLTNFGSITGTNKSGVELDAYGGVSNRSTGVISGYRYGVDLKTGSADLNNAGTITASHGPGVLVREGSSYIQNRGLISGASEGVLLSGTADTVVNYGTISGATHAVDFAGFLGEFVAVGGSELIGGAAVGYGGTLALYDATGTITGLGVTGTASGGIAMSFTGFGEYHLYSNASMKLTGTNEIESGQALLNAGTLTVSANAELTVAGAVTNSGAIDVKGGSGSAFAGLQISGVRTLSGNGSVSLNATGFIDGLVAGDSLINAGNTIIGAGVIKGPLTLTNGASGVIDASAGTMGINLQNTLINDGLIESTGTGTMFVRFTTIDSSGGGTIVDGKRLWLDTSTLKGGSLTIDAGASVKSGKGAATVNLGTGTVANAGIIEGTAGGLTIEGVVSNNHVIESFNGDLTITGAVTGTGLARLLGKGALEFDATFAQRVTFVAKSTATLVLGDTAGFTGAILGFSKTGANHIDLKEVAFNAADKATYKANKQNPSSGGTLTLANGTTVLATLHLAGTDYTGSTFTLTEDSSGGTIITDPPKTAALTSAMASFGASGASSSLAGAPTKSTVTPVLSSPTG